MVSGFLFSELGWLINKIYGPSPQKTLELHPSIVWPRTIVGFLTMSQKLSELRAAVLAWALLRATKKNSTFCSAWFYTGSEDSGTKCVQLPINKYSYNKMYLINCTFFVVSTGKFLNLNLLHFTAFLASQIPRFPLCRAFFFISICCSYLRFFYPDLLHI